MMLGLKSGGSETVSMLSHHVTARYFKFIPKLIAEKWACMRLEMYGCDSNKGKSWYVNLCLGNPSLLIP